MSDTQVVWRVAVDAITDLGETIEFPSGGWIGLSPSKTFTLKTDEHLALGQNRSWVLPKGDIKVLLAAPAFLQSFKQPSSDQPTICLPEGLELKFQTRDRVPTRRTRACDLASLTDVIRDNQIAILGERLVEDRLVLSAIWS